MADSVWFVLSFDDWVGHDWESFADRGSAFGAVRSLFGLWEEQDRQGSVWVARGPVGCSDPWGLPLRRVWLVPSDPVWSVRWWCSWHGPVPSGWSGESDSESERCDDLVDAERRFGEWVEHFRSDSGLTGWSVSISRHDVRDVDAWFGATCFDDAMSDRDNVVRSVGVLHADS